MTSGRSMAGDKQQQRSVDITETLNILIDKNISEISKYCRESLLLLMIMCIKTLQ